MMTVNIPGQRLLQLSDLILDYNGTVALDGELMEGVRERLGFLSTTLDIHILTADTFGTVQERISGVASRLCIIPKENQAQAKLNYVRRLGSDTSVCIGNGRNDTLMLKEAALGITVIQGEGASMEAIMAGNVVTLSILDALDLLIHPLRLTATLRL